MGINDISYLQFYSLLLLGKTFTLFGPAIAFGGSYVTSFVCLSVCNASSHTSHHWIFLIFCIKLAHYKLFEVHYADFPKKECGQECTILFSVCLWRVLLSLKISLLLDFPEKNVTSNLEFSSKKWNMWLKLLGPTLSLLKWLHRF